MAAIAAPIPTEIQEPTLTAAKQCLRDHCPVEPAKSAFSHFERLSENPNNKRMKEVAGTAITIHAKFVEQITGDVGLRGQGGPGMSWDKDYPSDPIPTDVNNKPIFFERFFTLSFPPASNNSTIEFKLVTQGRWQENNNVCIPLQNYGHIIDLTLDVTFAKPQPAAKN